MSQNNPFAHLLPQQGQVYVDPRERAQTQSAVVDAEVKQATAPSTIRQANANAAKTEVETASAIQENRLFENAQERKAIRQAFQTDVILGAIRKARKIAQEDGGTGWQALLSGVPTTAAKRLATELAPIKGNLAFDRLQQMRDESKTGGAVGNVSEGELYLLGSTVADLDTSVDLPTFLERLDTIERHFIGMQLNALGVDPQSEEGRAAFKNLYNYTGVFDGETPNDNALSDPNAAQRGGDLPAEYQDAHLRYLRDNWGRMDPNAYVRFRTGLDEAFGQTPNLDAYANAASQWNDYARQGGTPESLGAVPAPPQAMSVVEQGINKAAQSDAGAFFGNVGNATAAGLPAYFSGDQQKLELLRQARPVASFFGELGGGALGTVALGGGAGMAGGRLAGMLSRPLGSEVVHSGIYGATQDQNALRGAAYGVGGAALGSVIGSKIGDAFPGTFAGRAVREADESVPTLDAIKRMENEAYARAEATGEVAAPEMTDELWRTAQELLRRNEKITPKGRMVNTEGPINDGMRLLQDYAGQPMTPSSANNVRNVLSEARMSPDRNQARIGRELVDTFDAWAQPSLPGIEEARRLAQRRIEGEQMARAGALGEQRGLRMKGNDEGDALRTRFGQLDDQITNEQAFFTPGTTGAIQKVARGDRLTNSLRALGKYGFANPLTSGGAGIGSAAAYGGLVDPIYAAGVVGLGSAGTLARKLANDRTERAAKEAALTALGGDEYMKLIDIAREQAAAKAGRVFGGIFGAGSGYINR